MRELKYAYQLQNKFLVIVPLPGGPSVHINLDEILTELETKIPSFKRKHILCEGQDGFWALVMPVGKLGLTKTQIYPLNALTIAEAKGKFGELIANGEYFRLIP